MQARFGLFTHNYGGLTPLDPPVFVTSPHDSFLQSPLTIFPTAPTALSSRLTATHRQSEGRLPSRRGAYLSNSTPLRGGCRRPVNAGRSSPPGDLQATGELLRRQFDPLPPLPSSMCILLMYSTSFNVSSSLITRMEIMEKTS